MPDTLLVLVLPNSTLPSPIPMERVVLQIQMEKERPKKPFKINRLPRLGREKLEILVIQFQVAPMKTVLLLDLHRLSSVILFPFLLCTLIGPFVSLLFFSAISIDYRLFPSVFIFILLESSSSSSTSRVSCFVFRVSRLLAL